MSDNSVEIMRRRIADVYPGFKWKEKVSRMYDDQVIAIFYSFAEKGKFETGIKKKDSIDKETGKHKTWPRDNTPITGTQLSF